MIQQEFFAHTQLYPSQVNIWYSNQGAPYTLYAITVPIFDITSPTPIDNTPQLEVAQQIALPISTGNILILNITSRTRTQTPGTPTVPVTTYYYFTITPVTVQTFGNTAIQVDQLQFTPSINAAEYDASPYNVAKGNILSSRKSEYIMVADRYKVGTLANPTYTGPLNIAELLSGSATRAGVQDSNYSNTGWTNGRYIGSKTTKSGYGTEPAISGRTFQGAEFPAGALVPEIKYAITNQQAVFRDYFYDGTGDTPGFQVEPSIYTVLNSVDIANTNQTLIQLTVTPGSDYIVSPQVGDLFRNNNGTEIFRVDSVGNIVGQVGQYGVYVTRGWNGVTAAPPSGQLDQLQLVRIFNIEQDKLSGVPKGQVYVKETGAALTIDSNGYVLKSVQVTS